jgi:hypothetical protein
MVYNYSMDTEVLIDEITEAVMIDRGFDPDNPGDALEWDEEYDDSQYTLIREDVDFIIAFLEERGLLKLSLG